jgi:ATP-dependent Clp protease ATP-binding subunit ClpA
MDAVFERFSDQARRVVVGAQEEALGLGHNFIGTEHLLLGILRDDGCAGFRLLEAFEMSFDGVRTRILEIIGPGQAANTGHIPFTPRAKKVLEMSLREALQLGDRFIGSEHILLGLLREGEGVGAQVLNQRGVTLTAVRERLGDVEREQAPDSDETEPDPEAVAGEEMIHVPAEDFARLVAEVARLRDLLRRHGIDPGEEPFGDEGDPPVA